MIIFSKMMLTFDSAEEKNVWFSHCEKSTGNCWVDFSGVPGVSNLNDPVVDVGADPDIVIDV
ncbi:MAG TPA: hypothetical protein EYQ00_07415 [Dehalococcoidia bacterium]|nr:hypothetical protein [Dehalococcoidia bacterium]